jgi:hypothetical protein
LRLTLLDLVRSADAEGDKLGGLLSFVADAARSVGFSPEWPEGFS